MAKKRSQAMAVRNSALAVTERTARKKKFMEFKNVKSKQLQHFVFVWLYIAQKAKREFVE